MDVLKIGVRGGQTGDPADGPILRRPPCSRGLLRRLGRRQDPAVQNGLSDRRLCHGLTPLRDLSRRSNGLRSSGRLHRLSVRRWPRGHSRSSSGPPRRRRDLRWRRVHSRSSSGRRLHLHGPKWRQGLRWRPDRRRHRHGRLLRRGRHQRRDRHRSRRADVQTATGQRRIGAAGTVKSAGFACLTRVAWV